MRQIALTAKDFDSLDPKRVRDQYVNPQDCPIYRALTAAGHKIKKVLACSIHFEDGRVIHSDNISSGSVYWCAKELREGAKIAIIKL